MLSAKANIISQLKKDILLLQGFRPANAEGSDGGLGLIKDVFPNAIFPTGAVHEFLSARNEDASASLGFISAVVSSLMKWGKPSVWISSSISVFPPGLKIFGIDPHNIIFIQSKKHKEILWIVEEALKTDSVSAVVGEINEISFLESRRFQLAVEQSSVTGFLLRRNPKNLTTASVARWRIKSLPTQKNSFPGIGFPKWNVELLKIRNGSPGQWQMEWRSQRFELIEQPNFIDEEQERKIV